MTGAYEFEDSNLDLYHILDYKKTDMYHGLPREDEFYTTEKNMKRPERMRNKPWPTVQEFWSSDIPTEFRLLANDQADWRKFKRWLMNYLRKIEAQPEFDYDKIALETYGNEVEIYTGEDFDKKEEVNTEVAVYKWTNAYYMTEKEYKALPPEKQLKVTEPPKIIDLSKAERVHHDKKDMNLQKIQAD